LTEVFDLFKFEEYKEDNCREVKKAEGGLPLALWETYSSFANSNGGVIILGVGERKDGSWYTTGLKNASKLKKNFWNTIHDSKKVSINLLSDKNVESYEVAGDVILVIYVPKAKRDEKPVYINNDIFGGTYRRDWEGDYHCTKSEIRGILFGLSRNA
jgi:predicted HTH transcriptional regulator